jgi:hypothetical protein
MVIVHLLEQESNQVYLMTGLVCAESDLGNGKTVGEAQLTVKWCHPDLSEPVMKGRNNVINMDHQERAKSWTSSFTNIDCTLHELTSNLYIYLNAEK